MPFPPLVEPVDALDADERARTARHAALAGFGEEGQRRLAAAHIAVVGAGGLGSPVVFALAAAGVGTLTVIDDDAVEASNLQRQVMHRLQDVGMPKVDSAVRIAADLSPRTVVRPVRARLDAHNAHDLLAGAHLVIDGTDTFETREAVASACEALRLPLVWGSVQGFDAQVTVFWNAPPDGAAPVQLSDLYPHGSVGEVPTCADVGVLGALCMQVGALLATQAIALIAGIGEPLLGRVLVIDGLRARQSEVRLRGAQPAAPLHAPTATTPSAARASIASSGATPPALVAPAELNAHRDSLFIDVRDADEIAAAPFPGARHVPLADVLADPGALAGLGPIVVVCQVGARARRAAVALRGAGIEASVLAGGVDAWRFASTVRV